MNKIDKKIQEDFRFIDRKASTLEIRELIATYTTVELKYAVENNIVNYDKVANAFIGLGIKNSPVQLQDYLVVDYIRYKEKLYFFISDKDGKAREILIKKIWLLQEKENLYSVYLEKEDGILYKSLEKEDEFRKLLRVEVLNYKAVNGSQRWRMSYMENYDILIEDMEIYDYGDDMCLYYH